LGSSQQLVGHPLQHILLNQIGSLGREATAPFGFISITAEIGHERFLEPSFSFRSYAGERPP
jgi:hypothetical protein